MSRCMTRWLRWPGSCKRRSDTPTAATRARGANPNAVRMTGLLGWGGAYEAMQHCDLCLLLGTNFPLNDFYPKKPKEGSG
jgi:thiamine pyrophosphate-dependent acetolactate synthase large subunit-like protein